MRVGPRNRRIRIERFTATKDDYNADIENWLEHCEAFAEVKFGTGAERREAAQDSASAPAVFRVLQTELTASVTPKDRIVFDSSYWDITSNVPSIALNRAREITAVRRTDIESEAPSS